MSYLVGELERRGIGVLAQLESGNSSLVCTPTELLAWDGMNVQRMALTSIAKVGRANGVLEISDGSSIQIRLGLQVENAALSGFFAQVKTATQAAKAQAAAASTPQPESVVTPHLEPERQKISTPTIQSMPETPSGIEQASTNLGRSPTTTMRMSDYADPLQAHVLRPVTSGEPRPKKYADVRGKIYDELGFSFEYATVLDRFKARFIDYILVIIIQRVVNGFLMGGVNAKTQRLEELKASITSGLKEQEKIQGMVQDYSRLWDDLMGEQQMLQSLKDSINQGLAKQESLQAMIQEYSRLATSLPGEQLRIGLIATVVSLLIGWLYYALLESGSKYGTFGKQLAKIGVVNYELERITFGQATVRYFCNALPPLLTIFLLFVFTVPILAEASLLSGTFDGTISADSKAGRDLIDRFLKTLFTIMGLGLRMT
jgi:uncharacterized RDD family membrane protein YckC